MRILVLVGLVATLVSSACSDETGILVQTTTRDGFADPIDELHFYVGHYSPEFSSDDDFSEVFVDLDPLPEVILDSRDLSSDPHRLMIRPAVDADPEARYAVAVMAYANGDKVGVGYLKEPVGFVQGSITQWTIQISKLIGDDVRDNATDCVRWVVDGTRFGIGNGNDLDCDGYEAGPGDCNDSDPSVNGIAERCDNGIDDNCDGVVDAPGTDPQNGFFEIADGADNSCDGICDGPEPDGTPQLDLDDDGFTEWGRYGVCSTDPGPIDCNTDEGEIHPGAWDFCDATDSNCDGNITEPTPCFFREEGANTRCLQGMRDCEGVSLRDCEPIAAGQETLTFEKACLLFTSCPPGPSGSRARCLVKNLGMSPGLASTCRTWHSPTTGTCSTGDAELIFPNNTAAEGDVCTYQIIGPAEQQGYKVSLQAADSGAVGQVVNACANVHLHIETTDASAKAMILIAFSQSPATELIFRVPLSNLVTEDCDALGNEALQCSAWATALPLP